MKPLVIVWRVTEQCNLSCPFCAYDRTLDRPRRHADEQAIRRFGNVLAQWRKYSQSSVLVSWLGGEPLLWPALEGVTETFRRDHGLDISTTTNGTTLHLERVRRHLLEHYAELTLSVDALQAQHDSMRGRIGVFDNLRLGAVALAQERRSQGCGPVLRVNAVLMRSTIATFPSLCRELAEWGIDEITCNQLGGVDRPEFYPANRLVFQQVKDLMAQWPDLRDELAIKGVKLQGGEAYLRRLAATTQGQLLPVEDCHAGQQFLFITEAGVISPCSFTTSEYGIQVEEIQSVDDLLALPARFRQRQLARRALACEDCQSTQVCEKFAHTA
jgi:radical SAM protein with 4Fe4S-binding SPASM domain